MVKVKKKSKMSKKKMQKKESKVPEPMENQAKKAEDEIAGSELYLTRDEYRDLLLREAQFMQMREQIKRLNLQQKLMAIEHKNAMNILESKKLAASESEKEFRGEYNKSRAKIEERLGINLSQYGTSDDGKLTYIGDHDENKEG